MRRLILATTFLIGLAATEASACAFTPFHFSTYGFSASSDMLANSGKPCTINLSTGGRHSFSAIVISAQARNGVARASASGVTYQSKPGYKGADSFAFRMTGSDASGSGTSSIQVGVTVQ
jgi:hypothetical protein